MDDLNDALSNTKVQPRIHSAKKTPLEDLVPVLTPISAHVDVSSLCNYKCSFCFQADTKGMKEVGLKRGFMDPNLFKKIIDDMSKFPDKLKKIKIGNHGEPTMHPNLPELIGYAKKSGIADIIEVFTNGSKLEPVLNRKIVEAGLQRINISLEGLSDERYLQVAGVKQDFSKIIDGVASLYQIKEELDSDLIIYVKVADEAHSLKEDGLQFTFSQEERDYFFDTFGPISDEIYIEKVVPQWAETQLEKQNTVSETGMYDQKINKWKEVCPFTFMYLHFNNDGTVSPCTLDWPRKVVIGNAKVECVTDIWNGKRLRDLRIAMLRGQRKCVNFCNNCSAPMVCVEEDLDPHVEKVLDILEATEEDRNLTSNSFIDKKPENINPGNRFS
jgi:radical SAM protein with 4Fe4S-binding SPASM domain